MYHKILTNKRSRWISRITSLFLLLGFLLAGLPQAAQAARSNATCVQTYTVQNKDTLNSIAKKFTVKFDDLISANNLKEPYTIFVGQKLCIPKASKVGAVGTGDPGATKALSYTVTHNKNGFVIRTSNFPDKSNYVVKVDNLATPGVNWVNVGRLNVKDDDSVTRTYLLPKDLLKANFLHICLKNQRTNALFCQYSVRYVP
jgi:LysM repeat protein